MQNDREYATITQLPGLKYSMKSTSSPSAFSLPWSCLCTKVCCVICTQHRITPYYILQKAENTVVKGASETRCEVKPISESRKWNYNLRFVNIVGVTSRPLEPLLIVHVDKQQGKRNYKKDQSTAAVWRGRRQPFSYRQHLAIVTWPARVT